MPEAFIQAASCLAPNDFLAIAESAIHRELISEAELRQVLGECGPRVDRLMAHLDRAESGTESYVRLRLRARNIKVQPQVEIAGVGRVDFLIGMSLVLEVDSREHHQDPQAYERDRIRDQMLMALGYRVIRVTYDQVMHGWNLVEARLLAVIRAGLHLRPLVPQP
ncbi:endonuclease domain-containing protein [Granulicoccus sp. GXG6511]|uniref:endonuclease domain-containing protein n=1 Tax=Granulicoccus sp. GXG6511 TaxID=3381351 RepID=UPI003D7D4181